MRSEMAMEGICYLIFGGLITAILLVAVLLVLAPTALATGWARYWSRAKRVMLFVALVFTIGLPADLLFDAVMCGRYYLPGDPIFQWLPFFPSGNWVVVPGEGGRYLRGASALTLELAWLALAIPVWLLAAVAYRYVKRRLSAPFPPLRSAGDA